MDNQNPQVIYTPQAEMPRKRNWFRPGLLFLPLLAIIAFEIVFGVKTLLTPISFKKIPPLAPVAGARLSMISFKTSYTTGDTVPVAVRLTTGGYTSSGTDLILNYDPKILDALPSSFIKGSIYSDYPYINVDPKSGVISVSGIVSPSQKGFKGSGIFGTINFKAKALGEVVLTIDFKKGATNKTNVIDSNSNQNVLDQVSVLKLDVK